MKDKSLWTSLKASKLNIGARRAVYFDISDVIKNTKFQIPVGEKNYLEGIDLVYRTLCAILYNFVPLSGHPGGSISSGRIVEGLLFSHLDYDFSNPNAEDADFLVYAAGHKAMGLYAMWSLRNELIRIGRPELLPEEKLQLRLEDLLGFRRNPTNDTPLFKEFHSKTLDGHPTPATPFVRIATGASGVGVPAALGLTMGALDAYGESAPKVHILEGEGGMTPGRVHESLAAAASARLHNAIMHVDWNQASIDSNHVCREGEEPGEYVQWNPAELCYCHDWNVIFVPNGKDFQQVLAAQSLALSLDTKQPTAIVYRTIKGWKYGIEGRVSHGAGHKFCSEGYYEACAELENYFNVHIPRFDGEVNPENVEKSFYDTLMVIRHCLESQKELAFFAAKQTIESQQRLKKLQRKKRSDAPNLNKLYASDSGLDAERPPDELALKPGESVTLRAMLGNVLNVLNKKTEGAIIGSAADLLGSTSVVNINKGFDEGLFNAVENPKSRLVAVGGICEDAMGAFMAGLSSFGNHIGVTSSYGAFIGALEHVAARLHGIGQQTKGEIQDPAYNTWIMINAHAGVKTGEDGPTHADPQVLQLLQENFPKGVLITLTPWDAQEIWPLMVAGLKERPAVLCPFVTRPADTIVNRQEYGLPPAHTAVKGIYAMRTADPSARQQSGTLVLQGNGVATIFVQEVLPKLDEKGLNLNVFYVASAELFNRLPLQEQEAIFPEALSREAMGITDFTLPTMYRWVRSNEGIERTLHSFRGHHYLGSGKAHKVLQEAGIHAEGQLEAILDFAQKMEKRKKNANGHLTVGGYPFKKTGAKVDEPIWLTCVSCGKKIDPQDYFGEESMGDNEYCFECEHREKRVCAYCLAYWMNANESIKFHCDSCVT
ncbi:MAG: hypothetical protein ACE5HS_09645 [bacterium]